MKKGQIYEGKVDGVRFPNKGMIGESLPVNETGDGAFIPTGEAPERSPVVVKNVLPGQRVRFMVSRKRRGAAEGRLLAVTERAPEEMDPPSCPHFWVCGGCSYQTLPYEDQLCLKAGQVLDLLRDAGISGVEELFEGIRPSPRQFGYRNKMEFTFGDAYRDGPLTLGLHCRGGRYDIVSVEQCRIVDGDFRRILAATQDWFRGAGIPFYHRMRHEGCLRHLLVRKAAHTGEILIDLVTTTQDPGRALLDGWCARLLALPLEGRIAGILHTKNDSPADAVVDEGTDILYGEGYFYEELLGLRFRITPFSFFQTNSSGAGVLYGTAREMIGDAQAGERTDGRVIFDLYSGTGTIAQILAPAAGKVVGVEIVEEAVEAARESARENGLKNCEFLAGDVLRVLDELEEKPDFIVLDPPRDGVHPKALKKIMDYGVSRMLYISCKPTSLARDLAALREGGYRVERLCCVDMFPGTVHTETVALLKKQG